jgi:hypothetical protein
VVTRRRPEVLLLLLSALLAPVRLAGLVLLLR